MNDRWSQLATREQLSVPELGDALCSTARSLENEDDDALAVVWDVVVVD